MISRKDLKQIVILSYMDDRMLEKLMPHIQQMTCHQNDIVFNDGDKADWFYMLKKGKVLLVKRISEKITVSVDSIKSGFSFGWAAVLDEGGYTTNAICAETCEIFSIRKENILSIMNEDPSLGHIFTQRLLHIIKKRLDHRTEQFLRAIQDHSDIQPLL